MIDIDRLSKRFSGRTVVNDLSFRIDRGEIVGLLGPNGAGKSTTLKMLSGFLAPSAGSIRIFGFDMQDKARQAQKLIGYLPENAPSYGEMTVEGFLAFVASIRDYSGREKRRRIDSAMDCMELRDERRSIIETLSKGFKRRVALAQAILHDPELLLLDEPTDGLDPNQKHQVRQLVKNLSESKIVVISTHILEEVSFMCSRALVINGGRLLADNTPGELRTRSRYHHAVSLSIEAPVDPLAIAMLPGVAGIEGCPDRAGTLTILARPGAQILPALNRLIHGNGWRVSGLRTEHGQLEEVFRQLTRETPA
ncbi:TPA: ATP-binding cassette domain-containing protein [Pseudomonas aeruginosa]|uniref:ABC transporter ATP-binding protein n=1 Tax=Pseudomonas aeruginosa TaxID=287 RepID=UPI000941829E|nr:ABC transporter ATP-binding protein [Pseudomonas aeruginosa]ELK4904825.1 ABC transporter ATP-binding protein [Pseudomonas aeruginosa]MBG6611920.1 ABC transporter ATP-binding protein [Pseudomonas aeruginosa]HCF4776964.1 ABC transporter ATP-binding protein [Pseudomonas aeruginosa]HEJ1303357.1 ABC transporter ATP-binding protein [Pseudomonas aeruginosa]HEJ2206162.1 ABC transporter ATP-binding protein [Pseudomonas aeruginosa]